jgi:hypothetical protein
MESVKKIDFETAQSDKMNRMKKFASAAVLAASLYLGQGLLRAQAAPQEQPQQTQTAANSGAKIAGIDLNTTSLGKDYTSTTLSETFLDLGSGRSLWLVGGQAYDRNLFSNSADFGLKYVDGKNLFRVTVRDDENTSGSLDVSYGFDTEIYINKSLTLLGDVSDFRLNGRSYTDFGVGQQIKFGTKNSVVLIYSDRQNTNSYRVGYMFDAPNRLASFLVDYRDGAKPVYTGFLSFVKYERFIASYDPNTKTASTYNLFAFGNKEIGDYAMRTFLKEQYILTDRSVTDSDSTVVFPASFFVSPRHKYADLLRINVVSNLGTRDVIGAFLDNAFMIGTSKDSGYIFTQNFTKNTSSMKPNVSDTHYGVGFGYRFGHLANFTPILSIQSEGATINLSASF